MRWRRHKILVEPEDVNLDIEAYFDKYIKNRHRVLGDLMISAKRVDLTGICPLIIM